MRRSAAQHSHSQSRVGPIPPDMQVQQWLAEQLAVAPPLASEQLCRLQLLLATDSVLVARKSA